MCELYHIVATTREVDTLAQAAAGDEEHGHNDSNDCNHCSISSFAFANEVELGVLHPVLCPAGGESGGGIAKAVLVDPVLKNEAGHKHGCEERAANADDQGDGETANRA